MPGKGTGRTLDGWLVTEVLGLVLGEETLGLDSGSGATGKLLVEGDDALHAKGIRSGAQGLNAG